jgi:hypothetical protein
MSPFFKPYPDAVCPHRAVKYLHCFWLMLGWFIPACAQQSQTFDIELDQRIEMDQPFPGAGKIESFGAQDIYRFSGRAGQGVFLDLLEHDSAFRLMTWQVLDPTGRVISLECFRCQDPGFIMLPRTGQYELVVGRADLKETGSYAFELLAVPEPEVFRISYGDEITGGQELNGSGYIEKPGASDEYHFEVTEDQKFILRLLGFDQSLAQVDWSLLSPGRGTLHSEDLLQYEPRIFNPKESGVFKLVVGDANNSSTGYYQFRLEGIPPPDETLISLQSPVDIVNEGKGGGYLQGDGSEDVFLWNLETPGWFFIDLKEFHPDLQFAQWELFGPTGQKVFSKFFFSGDPGLIFLPSSGDYRMVVGGNVQSGQGAYRIHIQPVPDRDVFDIRLGDTVGLNLPEEGAGEIIVPGAQDIYRFSVEAGDEVYIEVLNAEPSLGFMPWRLENAQGELVYDQCLRCSNPGKISFQESGEFKILVGGFRHGGTGSYGFRLWKVPPSEMVDIGVGVLSVAPGIPKNGSGNLDAPGEADIFVIQGEPGQTWYFRPTLASGSPNLMWRLKKPDGLFLFDAPFRVSNSHEHFFNVRQQGAYELEVYQTSMTKAQYGFEFDRLESCYHEGADSVPLLPKLTITQPAEGAVLEKPEVGFSGSIGLTPGATGMDLVLVIDSSESLKTNDPEDLRLRAVRTLLDSLPEEMPIRVALVDFNQRARLLQSLTSDLERVKGKLELLDQSGGTNIQLALEVALKEMLSGAEPGVAQSIILFSDGEASDGSPAKAAIQAGRSGVVVHTVYLGQASSGGSNLLTSIAASTCGNFRQATSANQLVEIFRNIANPVPILRMEARSSYFPDKAFPVQFGGQLWRAPSMPVEGMADANTTLTVRFFTDEQPQRILEESVQVRFAPKLNQPPVIAAIRNRTTLEDRPVYMRLAANDADHDSSELSWSLTSSNPGLISPVSGWALEEYRGRWRLKLIPTPDISGEVLLTITVSDPEGGLDVKSFLLTVKPVNDPPLLDPIPNVDIKPDASKLRIELSGIDDGSDHELQDLTFNVSFLGDELFSSAHVEHLQHASVGTLHLTPIPGASGRAEVVVTLYDGSQPHGSITRRFQAVMHPRPNQVPSIEWVTPVDRATYFHDEIIPLKVMVQDLDGTVDQVLFKVNGVPLDKPDGRASEVLWQAPAAGVYTLMASAWDNLHAAASTDVLTLQIVERPMAFALEITQIEDPSVVCLGDQVEIIVELTGGDEDGNVVHFFAGDGLQGVQNAAPYVFLWEPDVIGDFLLTAVAYREDGSVVTSAPIRTGVSETCQQAAIVLPPDPFMDPLVLQEYLFEMGVGASLLPLSDISVSKLIPYDLVFGLEDRSTGVGVEHLEMLEMAVEELKRPVYVMGQRLGSVNETMGEDQMKRWHALVRLQSSESVIPNDLVELQEAGFFQAILKGRFGAVETFELPLELEQSIADESAEVIAFTAETDLLLRHPGINEPSLGQPRVVVQNFPLMAGGNDHSMEQRKRLFQNSVCWLLRCGTCSNAILPVLPVVWQDQAETGQEVRQIFRFMNNGACELSDGRVLLDVPEGVVVSDVLMSQGLGWYRQGDTGRVVLNLGRLTSGAEGGIQAELSMKGLIPGKHVIEICSSSNNTPIVCLQQVLNVEGVSLLPAQISIKREAGGPLVLAVQGVEQVQYRVESSKDLLNWHFLGLASGQETLIPVPLNGEALPVNLFYRALPEP